MNSVFRLESPPQESTGCIWKYSKIRVIWSAHGPKHCWSRIFNLSCLNLSEMQIFRPWPSPTVSQSSRIDSTRADRSRQWFSKPENQLMGSLKHNLHPYPSLPAGAGSRPDLDLRFCTASPVAQNWRQEWAWVWLSLHTCPNTGCQGMCKASRKKASTAKRASNRKVGFMLTQKAGKKPRPGRMVGRGVRSAQETAGWGNAPADASSTWCLILFGLCCDSCSVLTWLPVLSLCILQELRQRGLCSVSTELSFPSS